MLVDQIKDPTEPQVMGKSLEKLAEQHGCKVKVLDYGTRAPHFEDEKLNQIAQAVNDFLSAPTIKDEFGHEHHLRRKFYLIVESNNPKLYEWYQKNRLRYNNILGLGFIQLAFQKTLDDYPEADKLFAEMIEAIPKSAEAFNAMSDNDKIRTTDTIARALRMALTKLEK